MPITKITISLPSSEAVQDIWKLFDLIIAKMEEPNPNREGYPRVDVITRKKFRAEVMKTPDEKLLEVFGKWVNILVPKLVPATPELLQKAEDAANMLGVDPLDVDEVRRVKELYEEDERQAYIIEVHRRALAKAREKKKGKVEKALKELRKPEPPAPTTAPKKSHHKKKVG